VQTTLVDKRSKVVPDVRTSQLVILATEKELTAVDDLIARLDIPPKQVLIEAKLFETSRNPKTSKGIDWSGSLGDASLQMGQGLRVTAGNNALPGTDPTDPITYTDPITGAPNTIPGSPGSIGGIVGNPNVIYSGASGFTPETFFLNADGLTAVVHFLNQSADAKVIATPRAVTLDNETADLSVTRAYPIFKNTAGTQGSPGGSEVTYTNLGTILKVTPRISANNYVNLRVVPEVSTLDSVASKIVAGTRNEADIYAIRKIETQVMIPSGNTLVLGGLVSDASRKGSTKVPILGDIPFIGLAFRNDKKERNEANLLIFITPTIVQDSDFQPNAEAAEFLKSNSEVAEEKPWGAWDDGKPWDWSKSNSEPEYK
jgi:type II secretory pathway component GspD/PulD (secretin)